MQNTLFSQFANYIREKYPDMFAKIFTVAFPDGTEQISLEKTGITFLAILDAGSRVMNLADKTRKVVIEFIETTKTDSDASINLLEIQMDSDDNGKYLKEVYHPAFQRLVGHRGSPNDLEIVKQRFTEFHKAFKMVIEEEDK